VQINIFLTIVVDCGIAMHTTIDIDVLPYLKNVAKELKSFYQLGKWYITVIQWAQVACVLILGRTLRPIV